MLLLALRFLIPCFPWGFCYVYIYPQPLCTLLCGTYRRFCCSVGNSSVSGLKRLKTACSVLLPLFVTWKYSGMLLGGAIQSGRPLPPSQLVLSSCLFCSCCLARQNDALRCSESGIDYGGLWKLVLPCYDVKGIFSDVINYTYLLKYVTYHTYFQLNVYYLATDFQRW